MPNPHTSFYHRILGFFGWKVILPPTILRKSVICIAPHTSNLDFHIGLLYYLGLGRKPRFVMKKEWFVFPLSYIFRALGGVSVDRSKKSSTVDLTVAAIRSHEDFNIGITPEGTRSHSDKWHTGFYRIALAAGVPIELAKIDYKRKIVGIFEIYRPIADIKKGILEIRSRYSADMARWPSKFADLTLEERKAL